MVDSVLSRSRSSTQSQRRGPTARSSSSPYPFHPDRLDPASPPNSAESYDNSVNWYYSTYNNNNNNNNNPSPRAGPRHQRTSGERLNSASGGLEVTWTSLLLPTLSLMYKLYI